MIVRLDRERALRLAREVRSWHRADDDAGALDCFLGLARGELTEDDLRAIWREVEPEKPALALHDEFMRLYRRWASVPRGSEFSERACDRVAEHIAEIAEILDRDDR
jgi:hypothetical protein